MSMQVFNSHDFLKIKSTFFQIVCGGLLVGATLMECDWGLAVNTDLLFTLLNLEHIRGV